MSKIFNVQQQGNVMNRYFAVLCLLTIVSCVQIEQTETPSIAIENTSFVVDSWCKQRVVEQYLPEFNLETVQITSLRCWPQDSLQVQFELTGFEGSDKIEIYFYAAGGASYARTERCLKRNGEIVISEHVFERIDGYESTENSTCAWKQL